MYTHEPTVITIAPCCPLCRPPSPSLASCAHGHTSMPAPPIYMHVFLAEKVLVSSNTARPCSSAYEGRIRDHAPESAMRQCTCGHTQAVQRTRWLAL